VFARPSPLASVHQVFWPSQPGASCGSPGQRRPAHRSSMLCEGLLSSASMQRYADGRFGTYIGRQRAWKASMQHSRPVVTSAQAGAGKPSVDHCASQQRRLATTAAARAHQGAGACARLAHDATHPLVLVAHAGPGWSTAASPRRSVCGTTGDLHEQTREMRVFFFFFFGPTPCAPLGEPSTGPRRGELRTRLRAALERLLPHMDEKLS